MPYDNVPKGKQADMESCVQQVKSQGYDKERAAAICYASVVEGMALQQAIAESDAAVEQLREHERMIHYSEAAVGKPASAEGKIWDVVIMGGLVEFDGREYVESDNGRLYAADGLKAAQSLFEGAEVCDNHLTNAEFVERGGMRSFKNEVAGFLEGVRWESGVGLVARLKVVDAPVREKLLEAHGLGVLKNLGLSVDVDGEPGAVIKNAGREYQVIEGINRVFSVDIVLHPAAGGSFSRLIAAQTQEGTMKKDYELDEERVKELIAEALAGEPLAVADDEEPTPVEAAAAVVDAVEQAIEEGGDAEDVAQAAEDVAEEIEDAVSEEDDDEMSERVRKLECALLLRDKLDAARLDAGTRAVVEAAFTGRAFKENDLNRVIKRAKESQARRDPTGKPKAAGAVRPVGLADADKRELDLMRMVLGKRDFEALADSEADYVRDALPRSYSAWMKAGSPNLGEGHYGTRDWMRDLFGFTPRMDNRTVEAMTTTSLSTAVKNTVNIRLANEYGKREEWWLPLVVEHTVDTIDEMTLARIFGLDALDVVAEGAAYTEFSFADEEETASFVKNGNYLGITLETLLRDKLGVTEMQSISQKLASSWYNTLSDYVAGVFTVNSNTGPVLSDSGALFNATAVATPGGHANLLTDALSFTAWDAVVTAMMSQTDQPLGAGRKLGMENMPKFLLAPVNLRTTALRIRNSEMLPGSANNDINPHYQGFEVVVVPTWTDTNDWAAMADPNIYPSIHLVFPTGNRVPQIFSATDESVGAVFSNDTLQFKARLMTYRVSETYNCAPVSDWRPLHKSNVA